MPDTITLSKTGTHNTLSVDRVTLLPDNVKRSGETDQNRGILKNEMNTNEDRAEIIGTWMNAEFPIQLMLR